MGIGKLNTVIKFPDGRIGTVCYNHLDGVGGVFGRHHFIIDEAFSDKLPEPEFLLREKEYQPRTNWECVCEEHQVEVIYKPDKYDYYGHKLGKE